MTIEDGYNAISRELESWLLDNGFEEVKVGFGSDFSYYLAKSYIQYSLMVPSNTTEDFERVLADLGCKIKVDQFYSSFLHELGHHETYELLEDDEIDFSESEKNRIRATMESDHEVNMTYYYLPDEIIATQWAVDFMNEHTDAVIDMINRISPKIHEFYKIFEEGVV